MKLPTKDENSVKITQGIHFCGAFVCHKFGKKLSVLGAAHLTPAPVGVQFGGVDCLSTLYAKF